MSIRDKLISNPLGYGSAPLGTMFRDIPEAAAAATVDHPWQHGIRYFDTAPLYGPGMSEMRLGRALAKHKRGKYVLSSMDMRRNPAARWLRPKDKQERVQCGASFVRGVIETDINQAMFRQRQVQKNYQAITNSVGRIR